MLIRPATASDAEAIAEIYNREVTSSTVTFDLVPRTLDEQVEWLTERSGVLEVVVAERDGRVLGFASLSPYHHRAAYRTTVENSVYVHHEHRRTGVARALLTELLTTAEARGFHAVVAKVTADHEASIALHEAFGFERVGVLHEVGRKFGRWLDVQLLQKIL